MDETTSDLQQLVGKVLSVVRYRKWLFLLPCLAGTLAVLAGSLWIPRQYTMRTVFERREDPVMIKLVANSPYTFETLRRSLKSSLMGVEAVSNALATIQMPSADKHLEGISAASLAPRFSKQFTVTMLDSSSNFDLIELRYHGDHPELGEQLARTLRDNYIRNVQATIVNLQQQAQQFFADETEKRRAGVAQMQAELAQLVIKEPEVDPRRPDWLNERIAAENLFIEQLNRQKMDLVSEIDAREGYLRDLDEQQKRGKPPSTVMTKVTRDPRRHWLENEMTQVANRIAEAKAIRGMKDTHPDMEAMNNRLAQLRGEYEKLPVGISADQAEESAATNLWDQERNRVQMELRSFQGKVQQLELDLAQHQAERDRLFLSETTVFERQRKYMLRVQEFDTLKSDLAVWQNKLDEINRAMTASSMDRSMRFTTIEECHRSFKPVTPKLGSTFAMSGGVGLALGALIVFLREIFDRSFRTPARVRQVLGIPVLETIGEINVGINRRKVMALAVGRSLAGIQIVLILAFAGLNYLSLENPSMYVRLTHAFSAKLATVMGMINL